VEELKLVAVGWSVKKQILGKTVYNENNQKVGRIDDLIVAPDSAVSFAIIGAGGFVGLGRHDVAIPVQQIKIQDNKFVLPGATKEAIKALPKFEYAKK
jgi:sporulation protein YlmC with PRC-barrel domain